MFPYSKDMIVFIMRWNIDRLVLLRLCEDYCCAMYHIYRKDIMFKLSTHMVYC